MKKETLEVLKSVFTALDRISDMCDETETTMDDMIDFIRHEANGELAELEQLIIKLEET